MKKDFLDSQLNKIGLLKVFASMDTQSAIVAAVVISFITFLSAGFINLCNYIYWSAYFTKFNIPLSYIDEAIIHENGIKYVAVLCIPLLLFFWWILNVIKKVTLRLWGKITKNYKPVSLKILKWTSVFINRLKINCFCQNFSNT